jgi:hypothetical protein
MGPALVRRRLRVADDDVVWLRSVIEAYEGLGHLHGDGSGVVSIVAPAVLAGELDALLSDLVLEARLRLLPDEGAGQEPPGGEAPAEV